MHKSDPRYNASTNGTAKPFFARKEVIISGGTFNSPMLLKLSGIGPKAELSQFDIPVVVDLPGVGHSLQDNTEPRVIADTSTDFVDVAPACIYGAPGDSCLAAWYQGNGPYTTDPLDAIMFKSSVAAYGERDRFMWDTTSFHRGYWPAETVNTLPSDPPTTWGFAMLKTHPEG
jgi:choline dehydrogenase